MGLRRISLLVLGIAISTGICCIWVVFQQTPVTAAKGYAEKMPLPMFVEGTDLLAEEILTYEGEYIEDTEFGEFVFVTGLILRNTGDRGIVCAKVKLAGEKEVLEFDATYIPPGEAVMVLEKNRKETQDFSFRSCSGTVEYDENAWEENKGLQINPMDQNRIEITNITDNTVTDIQIYYKTIYPQDLFYIGGITNCYRIHSICAGESMIVSPEHFASKQSKIVCVKTGKT